MNPYYNESVSSMAFSQNGNVFQSKQLSTEFSKFFGKPVHIGSFLVYEVDNPIPIVVVDSNPIISSSSIQNYIKLLGDINISSNNLSSLLTSVLLTNITMQHTSSLNYCKINSQTSNIRIPVNHTAYALFTNGTLTNLTNYYTSPCSIGLATLNATHISFSKKLILTLSSGIISKNFVNLSSIGLRSNSNQSCITSNRSIPLNFSINIQFSSLHLTNKSHINILLQSNGLTLMGQLFSSDGGLYYSSVALNDQFKPFSWNTVKLASSFQNIKNVDVSMYYANGQFMSKLYNGSSLKISLTRISCPFIENSNSGHNLSNLFNSSLPASFKFQLNILNSNVTIYNLSVEQEPEIKYILFIPNGKLSQIQPAEIIFRNNGNIHVSITNSKLNYFYIIINLPNYQDLWKSSPEGEKFSTNYSTLFYFGSPQKNISLTYSTLFNQGMWILILELPLILSLYFILITNNRRKHCVESRE